MWTPNESTQAFLGVRLQAVSTKKNRFKKPLILKKAHHKKISCLTQHLQVKVYNAEPNQSPLMLMEVCPLISTGVTQCF